MLTVAMPLSFCVLRVASRVFFFSDKRSSYCAIGLFHEKRENAREDGEEVRKKGRKEEKRMGVGPVFLSPCVLPGLAHRVVSAIFLTK